MEIRNIFFSTFSLIVMLGLISCSSKTENAIEGCWVSNTYDCETLPLDLDLDIDISAEDLIKFKDKTFIRITYYRTENAVFAKASVSGKWSAYKDKGLRMEFDISSLKVTAMYEGVSNDVIKDLKKSIIEDLVIENTVIEDDGSQADSYNVEIVSPKGSEIEKAMTLFWDLPVEYQKITDSQFTATQLEYQLGQRNSPAANTAQAQTRVMCGSYILKGNIGDMEATMYISIGDNTGFNVEGSIRYAHASSIEFILTGSYDDNGNLSLIEYDGAGEDAKRTGEFRGQLTGNARGEVRFKGSMDGTYDTYDFELTGNAE